MSASEPPALAFDDVSVVRGGRLIWSEGTFEVPSGGITAVIGSNGSGKTTLLQVVLGLVPVASGTVEVLGRRKGKPEQDMSYRVGDLELDRLSHEVRRAGKEILLQPREYRLLEYLMKNAGQVVTRTMLLENVWDYHFDPQTNVIDVHVSRLRSKIEKDFDKPLLKTVRGAGYMIKDEG